MQPEIELGNRGSAPGDPGESIDDDSQKESKGKRMECMGALF